MRSACFCSQSCVTVAPPPCCDAVLRPAMPSTCFLQALGIALKLTFAGDNQLLFGETHFCILVVVTCVLTQMNYLNKVGNAP